MESPSIPAVDSSTPVDGSEAPMFESGAPTGDLDTSAVVSESPIGALIPLALTLTLCDNVGPPQKTMDDQSVFLQEDSPDTTDTMETTTDSLQECVEVPQCQTRTFDFGKYTLTTTTVKPN